LIHFNARVVAAVVLLASLATCRHAAAKDDDVRLDCGTNALYLLLNLEGRPTSLERLLAVLPAPSPEGYSMAELAAASGSLGLPLDGVQVASGDSRPDRVSIVYIDSSEGGHFAVVRPVGNLGKMVQVIDPPLPPWITDFDRLAADSVWTGRVLMPRDRWCQSSPFVFGTSLIAVLLVAIRLRGRRPTDST